MRAPAGDQFRRTAATAGVQQAPGTLSSTKGQETALKGSQTHLRLSPAETQPSCDASRHKPTGRPVLYYRCSNPTSRHMLTENANLLNKRGAVL